MEELKKFLKQELIGLSLKKCNWGNLTIEDDSRERTLLEVQEVVEKFKTLGLCNTVASPIVSNLLNALNDIKNWDEDLEDEWEDTGYRARAALVEYKKATEC